LAGAALAGVAVVSLEGIAILLDVLEAVIHQTTIAALVTE
jgi:hypothetical protein